MAEQSLKLAVFDMDGLIFDSERMFMEKLDIVMAKAGYVLTLESYLELLGMNEDSCERVMKKHYGGDYPYRTLSDAARTLFNEDAEKNGLPVKRGIPELLEYLNGRGVKCAVASSTAAKYVKHYLELSGLDKYFYTVVGGDMVQKSKPAPDIFLKACELSGAKPDEAVVFEDSENGIRAAHNGNIPVIWIPDMKDNDPDVVSLCAAEADDGFCAVKLIGRLFPDK